MKQCRDWSCTQCGSGWLEEVGDHKEPQGTTNYYCFNCKETVPFEWKIREVSDPDEILNEASVFCWYCKELVPADDIEECENFSHPVCRACRTTDWTNFSADMDAQDPKWGEHKV
jgi:hypothetical protein